MKEGISKEELKHLPRVVYVLDLNGQLITMDIEWHYNRRKKSMFFRSWTQDRCSLQNRGFIHKGENEEKGAER